MNYEIFDSRREDNENHAVVKKNLISRNMDNLIRLSQASSFDQRFNCLICWSPRLRMVYGSCQHRLCVNCLYDSDDLRRDGLDKCPTCQLEDAFPIFKPSIPEDNIALQQQIGVVSCTNSGCESEMWYWELEKHLSTECCFNKLKTTQQSKKRKSVSDKPHEYNLRHSSKRHSPGRYSFSQEYRRSSRRKMSSA
ncbi:TNF receptor-associated factor 6-A-like [Actinia tenebrosa]|uniref:TNF receptor-associated factor 6-A-like n=1 Tax=Actinia tenebrosa TaxID=6105 RepID=A0A6P8HYZ7_ACTTE|nr:TNF receptor-associated factor 6-A-like [Actinia tenebrosa]